MDFVPSGYDVQGTAHLSVLFQSTELMRNIEHLSNVVKWRRWSGLVITFLIYSGDRDIDVSTGLSHRRDDNRDSCILPSQPDEQLPDGRIRPRNLH